MAQEVYAVAVLIPAGTLKTAPAMTNLLLPERDYVLLGVVVPPGPAGTMGFALGFAGTPVLPTNRGGWIVTDDDKFDWQLDRYPDTGAWQFFGYNTGVFDHTVYLRFHANPASAPATPSTVSTLLPADALSSGQPPADLSGDVPLPPPEAGAPGAAAPTPFVIGGPVVSIPAPPGGTRATPASPPGNTRGGTP